MKLVLIIGPQAVGKMTVGQELAKLTNLKLFHNHMTIELVSNFFNYGTDAGRRLVTLFRQEIFEEVAKSNLKGLIFTFVWAFDVKEDWDYINSISDLFHSRGGDVFYIELESPLGVRLQRNTTENRLEHKPSKRNAEWSSQEMRRSAEEYRLNSFPGEINKKNYLRIDNSCVPANEVAKLICDTFKL